MAKHAGRALDFLLVPFLVIRRFFERLERCRVSRVRVLYQLFMILPGRYVVEVVSIVVLSSSP